MPKNVCWNSIPKSEVVLLDMALIGQFVDDINRPPECKEIFGEAAAFAQQVLAEQRRVVLFSCGISQLLSTMAHELESRVIRDLNPSHIRGSVEYLYSFTHRNFASPRTWRDVFQSLGIQGEKIAVLSKTPKYLISAIDVGAQFGILVAQGSSARKSLQKLMASRIAKIPDIAQRTCHVKRIGNLSLE